MKKRKSNPNMAFDSHLGCFGEFDIEDAVCRRLCALNLRCAIEKEDKIQMDLLEDLMGPGGAMFRTH